MDELRGDAQDDPRERELPFDQALILSDPELHYAELIRVVDIYMSLGITKISFGEANDYREAGTVSWRSTAASRLPPGFGTQSPDHDGLAWSSCCWQWSSRADARSAAPPRAAAQTAADASSPPSARPGRGAPGPPGPDAHERPRYRRLQAADGPRPRRFPYAGASIARPPRDRLQPVLRRLPTATAACRCTSRVSPAACWHRTSRGLVVFPDGRYYEAYVFTPDSQNNPYILAFDRSRPACPSATRSNSTSSSTATSSS